MRAALVTRLDGPDAIEVADVPDLEPTAGQVLIDVAAAGVSFPDVLLTRGEYQIKPPTPFVPGAEVAGFVRSAPPGAGSRWATGWRRSRSSAGSRSRSSATRRWSSRCPTRVTFDQGAALPMNYLTCHFALRARGRLAEGEKVLVHGAAGGIGTAAIQLAKAWGARVSPSSRSAKADVARSAGADEVVLGAGVQGLGRRPHLRPRRRRRRRPGGWRPLHRLAALARAARPDARHRLHRRRHPRGQGQPAAAQQRRRRRRRVGRLVDPGRPGPDFLRHQWDALVPLLESGRLDPVIGTVRSLDEVAVALRDIDERRATGKILLTP